MGKSTATIALLLASTGAMASAPSPMEGFIERLRPNLRFADESGHFRAQVSGLVDLDFHRFEGPAPGLLRSTDGRLWSPRISLFLDFQVGRELYGFVQARADRGFDPADQSARVRIDEYALRYAPGGGRQIGFQIGQFATVAGQWPLRHLSWQNPFINAPLLYEHPTGLTDLRPLGSAKDLRYAEYDGYYANPLIWGPAYTTGLAAFGSQDSFEWAVEIKNGSLISRPEFWPLDAMGFEHPSLTGRIAWEPDPRWTFGLSGSRGSFAGPHGFPQPEDFQQSLFLVDASYEHRHLQIWTEIAWSSFSMPGIAEKLHSTSWFLTVRYKVTPRLSVAMRWNDQRFSSYRYYGKDQGPWGDELRRLDFAATWRLNAFAQWLIELDHYWEDDREGRRLVLSTRLTVRF
jgi:hypothetical protein